jgi:hypothetical protein
MNAKDGNAAARSSDVRITAVDPHSADAASLIRQPAKNRATRHENDDGSGDFRPAGGERDLNRLLAGLSPRLTEGEFVFCQLEGVALPTAVKPLGWFEETEGTTVIAKHEAAERAGLRFRGTWRRITLQVHSSLEAVGLLAAVTRALADAEIPCNAVSAFHHDHLFVPALQADRAMTVLKALAQPTK